MISLALLGDALLYVVLPVNAAAFGVDLLWVGILLSANRLVRILAYGALAALGEAIGIRRLAVLGALAGAVSTLMYGWVAGGPALLAGRLLWGLSFAALNLATLAYAVSERLRAGARVGLSRAVQQVGPALSLGLGGWLAALLGPRDVFLWLGLVSLSAVPLALRLPEVARAPERGASLRPPRPRRLDLLFFAIGFAVDGVFSASITVILAATVSVEAAMISGGLVLALRRLAEMFAAPLAGHFGDRYGLGRGLVVSSLALALGLGLVAGGSPYAGAILVALAQGALAALGPAAAVAGAGGGALRPLSALHTWRDMGSALGPLAAGALIGVVGPAALYAGVTACVLAGTALYARA
ncbi:MAG: MFS transporter [Proteobacteria bacterium]|nr:MFS transporter [Pseudomonadota bacterium]